MKSNCTTPCSSPIRMPKSSLRSRYAPIARDIRTSVSYRMASAGAARTSKSLFTMAPPDQEDSSPSDARRGTIDTRRRGEKEAFVPVIALSFGRGSLGSVCSTSELRPLAFFDCTHELIFRTPVCLLYPPGRVHTQVEEENAHRGSTSLGLFSTQS